MLPIFTNTNRQRVSVVLRDGGDRTEVVLNLSYQQQHDNGEWYEESATGSTARRVYEEHFSAIDRRLLAQRPPEDAGSGS